MTQRIGGRLERGQSTVELALGLPFVLMSVLFVVQVGLVVRDQIRTVDSAREAVREAAVSADPGAVRAAALRSSGLPGDRTTVIMSGRGGPGTNVTVTVTYRSPTDVPLVGDLLPDAVLKAEATMRVEG